MLKLAARRKLKRRTRFAYNVSNQVRAGVSRAAASHAGHKYFHPRQAGASTRTRPQTAPAWRMTWVEKKTES
eukprot:3075126-Pleurochrysis_carterae.AAC.3